jgi:hypothetical protein
VLECRGANKPCCIAEWLVRYHLLPQREWGQARTIDSGTE